jgi:hypothetical protein
MQSKHKMKQWDAARTPVTLRCCCCAADGDNSTFNAEELADIVAIWRAVAEGKAQAMPVFNVDMCCVLLALP